LSCEDFARDTPACNVGYLDDRLQVVRQMTENCSELLRLEEASPDVVLLEQRNERKLADLAGALSESKHAAERC